MKIPGWFFFTVGVAGHLFLLLFAHFKGVGLGFALAPLPLVVLGLGLLHWPTENTRDGGEASIHNDYDVRRACAEIRGYLSKLDVNRDAIDRLIRPRMDALSRALAGDSVLVEEVHLKLQVALGDCQTRTERAWTAFADGQDDEARKSLLLAHASSISMCMLVEQERAATT